jgi:hypothetical protein
MFICIEKGGGVSMSIKRRIFFSDFFTSGKIKQKQVQRD